MQRREAMVWLARLGFREEGLRGKLVLEHGNLAFDGDRGKLTLRIALSSIRHVRRVRGSPVIVVEYETASTRPAVALYFSQPPPLPKPGARVIPAARGRVKAIRWLGKENKAKREEVKGWVEALRGGATPSG